MKTIKLTSEVLKSLNSNKNEYYNEESFISDAKRYIKAIKERRVLCNITSVSKSGMSRRMKFLECSKNKYDKSYNYLNFVMLFKTLGYRCNDNQEFIIGGCGMDMVFHTNYSIIHKLHRMNFINKKTCKDIAQNTPTCI